MGIYFAKVENGTTFQMFFDPDRIAHRIRRALDLQRERVQPPHENPFKRRRHRIHWDIPTARAAEHETGQWQTYALVDPLDHGAVIEVVRLAGQQAQTYRAGRGWEPHPDLLSEMQGPNPPLLVALGEPTLLDVLRQVDEGVVRAPRGQRTPRSPR